MEATGKLSDGDLFIRFYHDGESYEGEVAEWAKSEVGKRVKEIAEISFKAGHEQALIDNGLDTTTSSVVE